MNVIYIRNLLLLLMTCFRYIENEYILATIEYQEPLKEESF